MIIVVYFLIIGILLGWVAMFIGSEIIKLSVLLRYLKNKMGTFFVGKNDDVNDL
jgi:hypothetical protein